MTRLSLSIHDKLLERALKELFDPLTEYQLTDKVDADLILTDHLQDPALGNFLLLDEFPLNAERLLRDIKISLQNTFLDFGPNRLILAEKALQTPQEKHKLTEKEFDLLLVLIEGKGQCIGKEELLKTVWNYAAGVDSHTLETHIYRLRKKIEQDPSKPSILRNQGDGYCVIVDPTEVT